MPRPLPQQLPLNKSGGCTWPVQAVILIWIPAASARPAFSLCLLNGNPLQYSCLENPMDGGAWWATVHGVAKSRTRLSDFTLPYLTFLCMDSVPWQLRDTRYAEKDTFPPLKTPAASWMGQVWSWGPSVVWESPLPLCPRSHHCQMNDVSKMLPRSHTLGCPFILTKMWVWLAFASRGSSVE